MYAQTNQLQRIPVSVYSTIFNPFFYNCCTRTFKLPLVRAQTDYYARAFLQTRALIKLLYFCARNVHKVPLCFAIHPGVFPDDRY